MLSDDVEVGMLNDHVEVVDASASAAISKQHSTR